MLALRFALFGSLGAIALWGLFSLLDNLKEPELLRSTRAIVLKGCDPVESDEARALCAALRCQKALLESKSVPLSTRFDVEVQRASESTRLIAGRARATDSAPDELFACTVADDTNVTAKLTTRDELDVLLAQDGGWILESP